MPSIEQLERLLAADPRDPFVLYGLAQEHAKRGDLPRAVEFYDRCLAADPKYLYAYFHKAKAQEAAGRAAEAGATLETGLAAARAAGDQHAQGEIQAYLDELT
ncbi:MAG: tetratricopeptide repeat protein [Phycisphaerales bacterium]